MSATAFAYILVLRGGGSGNELMTLLLEERRVEVQAIVEKIRNLSAEEIRAQLRTLRKDQLDRQREDAKKRTGLQVERVAPKLYAWLTRPF